MCVDGIQYCLEVQEFAAGYTKQHTPDTVIIFMISVITVIGQLFIRIVCSHIDALCCSEPTGRNQSLIEADVRMSSFSLKERQA